MNEVKVCILCKLDNSSSALLEWKILVQFLEWAEVTKMMVCNLTNRCVHLKILAAITSVSISHGQKTFNAQLLNCFFDSNVPAQVVTLSLLSGVSFVD